MSSSSGHNKAIGHSTSVTYDIFVGNLPADANEKNVGRLFSKFGEIQSISVRDNNSTPGTKISYVRYYCDEDSKKAVEECNGCEVDGNRIIVKKTGKNDKRQRLPGDKSQSTGNKAVDKRMDKMNNRGPDIVPFEDRPNRHGGNNKQDGKSSRSSQSSLEDSGDETVLVSYVENCNVLWVQVVNEDVQERLLFVSNQLAEICPSAKMADNFQLIKIYAAKFSEDQLWYRCIIREQLGSNRVRVLFVDYGNEEEMAAANVVEVPQSLCEFKPFARKVILHLTKSKKFNDEKGVAFVKEFTNGKLLRLRPSVRLTDGTGIYGELFYEGMNLTDLFVQEGYIVKKILHQKNNQTIPVPSPLLTLSCSQPPLSSSTSSSLSTSNMASLNAGPLPAPCSNMDQLINMNKAVISHDRREMTSTSPSWGSVENMSLIQLRSELTSVKQELVQTRQENNVLSVELANTRTKLKNLQVEYNNKLAEESPHALLKKINSLIEKVKKLRSQFPSNGEGSSSTLAKAIELATSCDRMHTLSPGSLNTVNSLISVFNTLQKEILSTDKDQSELDELIETRDTTRLKLYENLSACLADLSNIPLEDKLNQMQDVVNTLGMEYKNFLHFSIHSVPPLADLLPAYTEWKRKKEIEFQKVRTETDSSRKGLSKSLLLIDEQMKLTCSLAPSEEIPDLQYWLKQFTQVLQQEIAVTDLEHSRNATFVTSILHAVKRELDSEQKTFSDFHRYITEFKKLKDDLYPWLHQKPQLNELQESKKKVRGLKSQLRHKLADLQDIEENEGYNDHHVKMKKELEEVRANLHQAITEEDEHMAQIAREAEQHFPELMLQNSELGLNSYLSYNGMVKVGREPDHYSLDKQIAPGIYQSHFNSKDILIQEYLIGDNAPVGKEEFLHQAKSFYSIQSPNLVPIQGVFFSKNQRQIYLQMPLLGQPFSNFLKEEFSDKERQIFVRGLCEGLHKLHSIGIVHGEIDPSTVLLKTNRTVAICMPDFSTPLVSRVRKRYMLPNGYSFLAPECQQQQQPTVDPSPATDVYHLGLMTLLWHQPDDKVSSLSQLSEANFPTPVKLFLQHCLQEDPRMRVSVNQLLASEYLNINLESATSVLPESGSSCTNPNNQQQNCISSTSGSSASDNTVSQCDSPLASLAGSHPNNYTSSNGPTCEAAPLTSNSSMVTNLYDNLQSPVSNVVQQLSKMMPLSGLYPGLSSLQFDDNLHAIYDQPADQIDMPSLAFQPMDKPDENGAPSLLTTNSNRKEFFNNQMGDCNLDTTPPLTPLQADYSQASTFSTSGGVTCSFPAAVGNGLCTDVHCNGESVPMQNSRDTSQLHCTESISPASPLPHMDSSNSGTVTAREHCRLSASDVTQNLQSTINQVNSHPSLLTQLDPSKTSG